MSTLGVFARAPERGRVKTRLGTALGEDAALALYEGFLADCLAVAADAARLAAAELVLAVAGPIDHPVLVGAARTHGALIEPQASGALGAKMGAFFEAHRGSGPVCLVGSDAPTLRAPQIARAFDELRAHEVVLGPGLDGGYWLIGARRPIPELLGDMPWSTSALLGATLDALRGRSATLLDFWFDVDDFDDLALLRRELSISPPTLAPATRRALVRAGLSC